MKRSLICGSLVVGAMLLCGGLASAEEQTITLESAPAAVQAAVKKAVGSGTLVKFSKEDEGGKISYEAQILNGKETTEIDFAPDGSVEDDKD